MKTNSMANLYQIIFINKAGTFADTTYLKHIIYSITNKMLESKGIDTDDSYVEDCLDFCYGEVIESMTKVAGKIPPEEIYPYCNRIISNSINHFLRRFYTQRKKDDSSSNKVVTISLDSTVDSEDGKASSLASVIADTKIHELDVMTQVLFHDIRKSYPNPRAMDWFILNTLFDYKNVQIAQMENISSSYIGREIKTFIQDVKKSHGEELFDCLSKYQGGQSCER